MKRFFYCLLLLSTALLVKAQREPDKIYMQNIHTVKLFQVGNQSGYAIISLGAESNLELDFDDFDGTVKNYNYTYQLCNADWKPADLNTFDFVQGFSQGRLSQYRNSSVSKVRYIHYQALLPERSCMPKLSGNYLLKVYLNGDTSKLAFTKRLLVVENLVPIAANIQQPFNSQLFQTHQKVQFTIDKSKIDIMNQQQQLKVVVLQNYRWDIAVTGIQPMFMRGNLYEYNGERDCLFPAGRDFRWADLRSFRFLSERVDSVNKNTTPVDLYLIPDGERTQMRYLYRRSLNGFYEVASTDVSNPWWQGDYARVHFTYKPLNNQPYPNKDVYVIGELTQYQANDSTKMTYNANTGFYEKTLLLKEGYYNYTYATKDIKNKNALLSIAETDGNYWQSENTYLILVYYHSFSDRADRLVGIKALSSLFNSNMR